MNAAVSAPCSRPSPCPSVLTTRRPWRQRVREGLQAMAGQLLAAARREPEPELVAVLDARALRDIGWCCEAPLALDPRSRVSQQLPELW